MSDFLRYRFSRRVREPVACMLKRRDAGCGHVPIPLYVVVGRSSPPAKSREGLDCLGRRSARIAAALGFGENLNTELIVNCGDRAAARPQASE